MHEKRFTRLEFIRFNSLAGLSTLFSGGLASRLLAGRPFHKQDTNGAERITWSRTMYRPDDIENARRNIQEHEWAAEILRKWRDRVEDATSRSREFFDRIIPDLTPGSHYGQTCPNCVGERSREGHARFLWEISDPDRVTCADCHMVYPNDSYPETGALKCPRMGQVFSFYIPERERANPDAGSQFAYRWNDRPVQTSFSGLIRNRRVRWAWTRALELAKLYAVTNDIVYAERVAWILDRLSRVFPDYLYKSYDGTYADLPPAEVAANMGDPDTPRGGRFEPDVIRQPYGLNQHGDYATLYNGFWGAGRLTPHGRGSDAGPLLDLTIAYDLIQGARYSDGRPVLEEQAHHRILDDLIVAGCNDYEHWDSLSNKGIATRPLSAAVGRLMNEPRRVHRAMDGLSQVMNRRYHFDGFYSESPSYALHNYSNMRELPDLLLGYSEPGTVRPAKDFSIEHMDPYGSGRIGLALLSKVRMLAPDNRLPVIGDTPYERSLNDYILEVVVARMGPRYAGLYESVLDSPLSARGSEYSLWFRPSDIEIPENTAELPLRTEWFPGWHVGVLRADWRNENDTALYLVGNEHDWTVRSGHRHRDILSINHYAYGKELISDRGYFSGSNETLNDGRFGQRWTSGTHSHNLVVVDEENQIEGPGSGSNLDLFGVTPGLEVVQAEGVNAYEQVQQYRRTTALIRIPGRRHYIVDFFRVSGGTKHQYSFHCNGSLKEEGAQFYRPLDTELGEVWNRWVRNPRAIRPESPHTFTWEDDGVYLDLTVLNTLSDGLHRIVTVDAPGWRRSDQVSSPAAERAIDPIRQILAERRSSESKPTLNSQFAALMTPYHSRNSPVRRARLIENNTEEGVVAIEVELEGRTDYIISAQDQVRREFGPVTVAGEFAFVSIDNQGRPLQGYLLKGTQLESGNLSINLPVPEIRLPVRSVDGRKIHLAKQISPDLAPAGSYLLVRGPEPVTGGATRPRTGFEIESTGDRSITVRDYPVPDCNRVSILNSGWVRMNP